MLFWSFIIFLAAIIFELVVKGYTLYLFAAKIKKRSQEIINKPKI